MGSEMCIRDSEDTELAVWKSKCASAAAVPILVCEEVLGSNQLIDFVANGGKPSVAAYDWVYIYVGLFLTLHYFIRIENCEDTHCATD